MKFKLHNKYEITINNKKYTAYNTLLNTVYDKISNLEQFTSHIAIGTGTTEKTVSDTKLSSYLMSLKLSTEEIQSDVSQDVLYIKKSVIIDESFTESFSFSEIGITDSSDFDPTIYNHVLLKDKDNNVVSVTRNAGDVMEIRVTIYLDLTNESKALFIQGENDLIKQILGEELSVTDNNLYALRGENLFSNEFTNRSTPDLTNAFACKKTTAKNSDGTISLNYTADLGEGDTEEVILIFNNQVCLRLNALEYHDPVNLTNSYTCETGNFIDVDKNIKAINSVTDSETSEADTTHTVVKYSRKLTDKISNLFNNQFDSNTTRYVSKDGNMIAFIQDSYMYLYKHENYAFTKISTSQVSLNNIQKVIMFDDTVLIVRTEEPYISIYKVVDNILEPRTINFAMYDSSAYSYDWLDVDATKTTNKILIGVIINNTDQTPLALTLTENESNIFVLDYTKPTLETAKKVYAIYKNNYTEPRICFVTDTYSGGTYYLIEDIFESTKTFVATSDIAYSILNNTQGIYVSGRGVYSQKSASPYLTGYYLPSLEVTPNDFSTGIKHYFSCDGNYVIASYGDSTYKIFNLHNINALEEFVSGFPSFVDLSLVTDFEFIGDLLLVFTSDEDEPIYGIALKNNYLRLENLAEQSKTYTVDYDKYDLLGSRTLEGVKVNFNIKFTINSEE